MEIKKQILTNIFDQTELYLKEIGEFAPFGAVINLQNEVVNLGYQSDEEIVNSIVAIKSLEENIQKKIYQNNYVIGAIGINVSIKVEEEPKDALLVKVTEDGVNWTEDYYPYDLRENNVIWH